MYKLSKRAIPILIMTTLLLTLLQVVPAHAAIDIDLLNPDNGVKGDTIEVTGDGVTAGATVNVYWDAVKAWDGSKGLLNSTEAEGNGSYEVWFDVPEAYYGDHYVWVKDMETGQTATYITSFWVDAKLSLSPSSGLKGDTITIKGYGFEKEEDIVQVWFDGAALTTLSPATPETNTLGSWTATFKVPDKPYFDSYVVQAWDEGLDVTATKTFKIGTSIKVTPDAASVGSVVSVEGRGFTPGQTIDTGVIEITYGILSWDCEVVSSVTVKSDGTFRCSIVIPQTDEVSEDHKIQATDPYVMSWVATTDFEVTGLAEIKAVPSFGAQGTSVIVSGYNFSKISGKEVIIELGGEGDKTFKTDSAGKFSGSFLIPALVDGVYLLTATQSDYLIDADASFRVGVMLVILSPATGPTGKLVSMTGIGFTDDGEWNATLGDILIGEDTANSDGSISHQFYVPTLPVGTYTLTVLDIDEEIEVTAQFTVTATTVAWTDPAVAPNEYNVTIKGSYFSCKPDGALTFVIYNASDYWDMTVTYEGVTATLDDEGNFTGYWEVLDSDVLGIGAYTINVTDENDLFTQISFNIVEKTIDVVPRKPSFAVGETVSFNIKSSFAQDDSYMKVWDPDDNLVWKTDAFTGVWLKVGTIMTVPYYQQTAGGNPMILITDAPLGTWTWKWYDEEDEVLKSGNFVVVEAPEAVLATQMQKLTDDFSQLSEDFMGVQTDLAGVKTDLAGVKTDVAAAKAAADAAKSAADAAKTAATDVAATANAAKTAADSAKSAADAAKTSADEARTAATGLTTLVYGAIGASLVAALAAIVSLMQISRRIAG